MRIFHTNHLDLSTVVYTPTSEVSTLPASNLGHEFRKKPWRTGASTAAENVVIDLGSAKAVTAVILLDHTITNADTLIKLEGNSANSWGAPAFTQTLTWASGTIGQVFASQTLRYWRLSFTKSSAAESRDIGRMFLGTYYETVEQPDFDGYNEELMDLARKQKGLGGQTYTEIVDKAYAIKTEFSRCPETQIGQFKTLFETLGESVAFFAQVDTVSPLDKYWYVKLKKAFTRKVAGFDSALYWDVNLEMEEQL